MINNLSRYEISFLSTIDKKFSLNKSSRYKYLHLDSWNLFQICMLLSKIQDNNIFLIFPFVTASTNLKDPYLRLSEPFLVTNQSNSYLITNFLIDQWNNSNFEVLGDNRCWFNLKYKPVIVKNLPL
jgi:hypothetical protein